jgi:glutamate 5-kinase
MTSTLETARRIVVKTGSALVAERGTGGARTGWIGALMADIAALKGGGKEIILVSSGAIALARPRLYPGRGGRLTLEEKQAAAAVGQPVLMGVLAVAGAPHGLILAQALLTLDDTERRRRWLNARATLNELLAHGILPVINENDTVATDEIRYGDNDRLAARVAQMTGAELLILLSDVDGLYTADPNTDPSASHIAEVAELTPEIMALAGGANAKAGVGSGGMATKLAAARIAQGAGCATLITRGDRAQPLRDLMAGARATLIRAPASPETARRQWLKGHLTPEGSVSVDEGAARALLAGSSLLAVGVTGVRGPFERGAAIAVLDPLGREIAKGVTAYGSTDIARIKGLHSDAMEAVLGYEGRPAVIHRDDMVLAG